MISTSYCKKRVPLSERLKMELEGMVMVPNGKLRIYLKRELTGSFNDLGSRSTIDDIIMLFIKQMCIHGTGSQ